MNVPMLYRKRFIPNECIYLKDDIIVTMNPDFIVTKWKTLHPRKDIARGISAFYLDQGIKVSKIYDKNDQIVYWYCDIIKSKQDSNKNTVIIEDLLVDVLLYNDGSIRIVDMDELADALDQRLISKEEAAYALRALDHLLQIIYSGRFHDLQEPVNQVEQLTPLPSS